jgi:tellurite resistance protein
MRLRSLGFAGAELYLAELIPAVEMAWADGVVRPNELAILEAFCEALVESLNAQAGARLFRVDRALTRMHHMLHRRLSPAERQSALLALRDLCSGPRGLAQRKRMVEWAEAVAAVDGSPVWDARELFWLERVRQTLEVA